MPNKDAIVHYWLGSPDTTPETFKAKQKLWYNGKPETDDYIRRTFGQDLAAAERGELKHWGNSQTGSLALVILLDQFSRNLYRGTSSVYRNDPQAQQVALSILDSGETLEFNIPARIMFCHPLHHAEDRDLQLRVVALFEEMLATAPTDWQKTISRNLVSIRSHCDIINQFGRFPHRNQLLGRPSTTEEIAYLEKDNRRYGQ